MVKHKPFKMTVYHGSPVRIESFDYAFTEIGFDQLGSGFYFTTDRAEAMGYAVKRCSSPNQQQAINDPTVHVAEVTLSHPVTPSQLHHFKRIDIIKIIKASPILDECLANWGDIEFDGKERLIKDAADTYDYGEPVELIRMLNTISNDFYPGHVKEFVEVVRSLYGFDGVRADFGEFEHLVAWFPEQIANTVHESVLDDMCELSNRGPVEIAPHMFIFQPIIKDNSSKFSNDVMRFFATYNAAKAFSDEHNLDSINVYQLKESGHIADLDNVEYQALLKDRGFDITKLNSYSSERFVERGFDGTFSRSDLGINIYKPDILKFMGAVSLTSKRSMKP